MYSTRQPPLMRRQPALEAQPPTQRPPLAEQGMAENLMGQAAGEQAFARFVPVQLDQLAKAQGLLRVFEEGAFAQLHLPAVRGPAG